MDAGAVHRITSVIAGATTVSGAILASKVGRTIEKATAVIAPYRGGREFWTRLQNKLAEAADSAHELPESEKRKMLAGPSHDRGSLAAIRGLAGKAGFGFSEATSELIEPSHACPEVNCSGSLPSLTHWRCGRTIVPCPTVAGL
jgi:hypothetical protein